MRAWRSERTKWLLGWLALTLLGTVAIIRWDIAQRRTAFEDDARVAHRQLSQRAAQHEAILGTLVLLAQPIGGNAGLERRLPALYPQLLDAWRRERGEDWQGSQARLLAEAEGRSRASGRAELGGFDASSGRYTVVMAGEPVSFGLQVEARRLLPPEGWPFEHAPLVRAALAHGASELILQAGVPGPDPAAPLLAAPTGLTPGFVFSKRLATDSQPFELRVQRPTGPAEWPWTAMAAWAAGCAAVLGAAASVHRSRVARRRAEAAVRIGRVARLNALGELAAGLAHEINQPLTAVLASTQAARRLLDDEQPDTALLRQATTQAAAQARRAADVLARLRTSIAAPAAGEPAPRPLSLRSMTRQVLDLAEPEVRARGVRATIEGEAVQVMADPVAVEQILVNLLDNALHALESVPVDERRLVLRLSSAGGQAVLSVIDSGPGIAADAMRRLFEPFYTKRAGGLGLGLSLSETLAQAMGGALEAQQHLPRGAEFRLSLPLAPAEQQ